KQQFVAVLVHELGHYSDSNKVPAYQLIHFVTQWLENRRVMPDSLDVETQHPGQEKPQLAGAEWIWAKANELPRAYLTSLVFLSRKINHRVGDWLEYCADYYTAYFLGVDHFDEVSKGQAVAHATYQAVSDINAQAWKHHKLLRNFPDAVLTQHQQWSDDERQKLLEQPPLTTEDNWRLLAVSDSRNARVENLGFKGVYKDTSSAAALFSDFSNLSEKVTIQHYRQQYHDEEFTRYIVDNSKIISMSESLSDAEIALDEFLGGAYVGRLIEFAKPVNSVQFKMSHQQTIDWIRKHLVEYRDDQKLVKELYTTRQEARLLLSLIETGVDVSDVESSIENRSKHDLSVCLVETDKALAACYTRIAEVDHMIAKRIMMTVTKMSSQDKDVSRRYLTMVRTVGGFGLRLRSLAEACVILRGLIALDNPSGKLLMKIDAVSSECKRLLSGILTETVSIAVFSDDDRRSLREYINSSTRLDTKDLSTLSFERLLGIAEEVEKVILYHYTHTLGQLAKECHREEVRIKIRPLKLFTK
ncbi:MAG: hypothetical protein O7F73_08850, partial [Gammaproteobacteria bacterium]|nr:hypothetical protein [Gammaproteobacteria bacterium]